MTTEPMIADRDDFEPPRSLVFWLVAGYLALFIVRPWEELFPALEPLRLERVYGVTMIIVVALTGRGLRLSAQAIAVGLFTAAILVSTLSAWKPYLAWPEMYRYATVVVIYFVLRSVCRRPSELYWLITAYIFTMFGYLGKSLWEYFVHNKHVYAQNVSRLVGIEVTYGEPNAVAMSSVLSLPLWLFLWLRRREFSDQLSSGIRIVFQSVVYLYPLIVLVAVGLTNSRAGMVGVIAFVVGAAILFQRDLSWPRQLGFALIVVLLVWLVAPAEQKNRLRTLWNPDAGPSMAAESAGGRWDGFLAAMEMIEARPMFGVGVGNFVDYRVERVDGIGLVAHNLPGQILGETGWLGAICFSFLVFTIWRDARRTDQMGSTHEPLFVYWQLSRAIQLTVLLLFLFGLSLHNGLRYNWLWIAAFGSLAIEFALEDAEELELDTSDFEDDLADIEAEHLESPRSADSIREGFIS